MTKKHIHVSRWVDNVDVQVLPVLRVVGTKPMTSLKGKCLTDGQLKNNDYSQYTDRLQHSVTTTVSWMVQSLILVWIYCYVLNDVTTRNVTVFGQFGTTSCM